MAPAKVGYGKYLRFVRPLLAVLAVLAVLRIRRAGCGVDMTAGPMCGRRANRKWSVPIDELV